MLSNHSVRRITLWRIRLTKHHYWINYVLSFGYKQILNRLTVSNSLGLTFAHCYAVIRGTLDGNWSAELQNSAWTTQCVLRTHHITTFFRFAYRKTHSSINQRYGDEPSRFIGFVVGCILTGCDLFSKNKATGNQHDHCTHHAHCFFNWTELKWSELNARAYYNTRFPDRNLGLLFYSIAKWYEITVWSIDSFVDLKDHSRSSPHTPF